METAVAEELTNLQRFWNTVTEFCVNYGLKIIGAIIVLIIGLWIAKWIVKLIGKAKWFKKINKEAQGFVRSLLKTLLYIIVVITVISILGVPMASIIAVIASCGVAIGLALQGSLSNFAGGLMLIVFKPFRVGDYIVTGGFEGTVKEIGIFSTTLATADNRRVVLPNAGLSNTSLVNVTHYETRRVDHIFCTATDADTSAVVSILRRVAESQELRLPDMPVSVEFDAFGEGCAKYHVKVWCRTGDYWTMYYSILKEGKRALLENGIKIPLPQVEVHEAGH